MQELGYACTANEQAFIKLLTQFPKLNEASAAEVVGMMLRTLTGLDDHLGVHHALSTVLEGAGVKPDGHHSSWNFSVAVSAMKTVAPDLNWPLVAQQLDHEGFIIPDQQAFVNLLTAYKLAAHEPFPLKAVVGRLWANAVSGDDAVSCPPRPILNQLRFRPANLRIHAMVHCRRLPPLHAGFTGCWLCTCLTSYLQAVFWPIIFAAARFLFPCNGACYTLKSSACSSVPLQWLFPGCLSLLVQTQKRVMQNPRLQLIISRRYLKVCCSS